MADTSFMEARFPVHVSWGSVGGPDWPVEIVTLGSGHEERNTSWSAPLRTYDAKYGVRTHDELHEVLSLYLAAMGALRGFRLKDWLDYKSRPPLQAVTQLDQAIGVGTGALAMFQLSKRYQFGGASFDRVIRKPVAGTVRVAADGVEKTAGVHFNVAAATGIVTFTAGNIPTAGQSVTAGFEFDVPVRFESKLDTATIRGPIGDLPSILLRELRL